MLLRSAISPRVPLLTALLTLASPALADPLQEGLDAFAAGQHQQAVSLWQEAADADVAEAQYNLGLAYANGWGVEQDPIRAREWYRKAAQQGQPDAQYNLGLMYARGEGLFRNHQQAALWWEQAAARDHAPAQYNLALLYAYGMGVAKDLDHARALLARAAEGGYPAADEALQRLAAPEQ